VWRRRPKYKKDSALADDRKHYEGIGCIAKLKKKLHYITMRTVTGYRSEYE